jgi:hypothetical protein
METTPPPHLESHSEFRRGVPFGSDHPRRSTTVGKASLARNLRLAAQKHGVRVLDWILERHERHTCRCFAFWTAGFTVALIMLYAFTDTPHPWAGRLIKLCWMKGA